MLGVHALIPEDTTDLIDLFQAADDQTFQVQLQRNTKLQVLIQGVKVGQERPRGRAAGVLYEHGRFDFKEALPVEVAADAGDDPGSADEGLANFRIHDQVGITLAVAKVRICHAVIFLRQRTKGLRKQRDVLDMHRDLTGLGLEDITADADDIAHVVFPEVGKLGLRNRVLAHIELDLALAILDVAEDGFAHAAFGHDASGNADLLVLVVFKGVFDPGRGRVALKSRLTERIASRFLKLGQFVAANLQQLGHLLGSGFFYFFHGHSSGILNGENFQPDLTRGRGNCHGIARTVTDQALADRRVVGDSALAGIGLLRADDFILIFKLIVQVPDSHKAAKRNRIFREIVIHVVHDFGMFDQVLILGNTGIQLALLGFCLVVLAVLGQVAEASGFLDLFGDFLFTDGLHVVELFFKLVQALLAHFVTV